MTKAKIRFKQVRTKNGIWTDWERPVMNGYHMACCDCGLVHTINFRVVKVIKEFKNGVVEGLILPKNKYQVEFKLFRNHKLTKQQRKKK